MTLATALYGGGIKSIQQGTITVAAATSSNTATISSVATAKAFVLLNGFTFNFNASAANHFSRVELTNATTVTATRNSADNTYSTTVAYTVVEFN